MYHSLHVLPDLLITLLPNVGTQRYWQLIDALGSADAVMATDPDKLTILNSQAKTLLSQYQHNQHDNPLLEQGMAVIEQVSSLNGFILSVNDKDYPALLKEVHQPPPILYGKGSLSALSLPQLAIVGSRNASHAGLQNTRLFAQHLSASGFTITSGLALGIDAQAHQAAVDKHHTTIAVMATGIDDVYPKQHYPLSQKIIDNGGTLLTEFRPLTAPKAGHFPKRNRIISGLSAGVLVIESSMKSGSLITARLAMEQGREVFAIPGSIHHPQSKGGHWLIKQGATLVENSQDIIDQLSGQLAYWKETMTTNTHKPDIASLTTEEPNNLSKDEAILLRAIPYHPVSMDEIIAASGLSSDITSVGVVTLTVAGLIKHSSWGYERL